MKQEELVEGIGREIIKRLHDYNEEEPLDDAEYIPLIKRIIEAIKIYSNKINLNNEELDTIDKSLVAYSRELYIELCKKHAKENNEDVTIEELKEESEEYFNYIYEYEEHPN